MNNPDPYAADAPYYDLIHGRGGPDVELWRAFAKRTDRPVLEMGIGTGRIGLALARDGHAVVGTDVSPSMLAVARQAVEDDALEDVTLLEGKVTDLALQADHYGFVLIPADVFLYCRDAAEQLATLRFLAATLAEEGRLALDLPGPAAGLDPTTNGLPTLAFSGSLGDGATLDVWHVHEDDLACQSRLLRVAYEVTGPDGLVHRTISEHRLRYVHRFEAEHLLLQSGLLPLDVYGDYDLAPLSSDSDRMIVIAKRAP